MNKSSTYSFPVDAFSIEKLKEYFLQEASLDNVNDEIANLAFQNYINDLGLEALKESKFLSNLGITFCWDINDIQTNMFYYSNDNPPNNNYSMRGYDGAIYTGADALLAGVVANVDIHTSVENFWLNRQRVYAEV